MNIPIKKLKLVKVVKKPKLPNILKEPVVIDFKDAKLFQPAAVPESQGLEPFAIFSSAPPYNFDPPPFPSFQSAIQDIPELANTITFDPDTGTPTDPRSNIVPILAPPTFPSFINSPAPPTSDLGGNPQPTNGTAPPTDFNFEFSSFIKPWNTTFKLPDPPTIAEGNMLPSLPLSALGALTLAKNNASIPYMVPAFPPSWADPQQTPKHIYDILDAAPAPETAPVVPQKPKRPKKLPPVYPHYPYLPYKKKHKKALKIISNLLSVPKKIFRKKKKLLQQKKKKFLPNGKNKFHASPVDPIQLYY